MNIKKF